jgi:hypothetical protein
VSRRARSSAGAGTCSSTSAASSARS